MIKRANLLNQNTKFNSLIDECNQLISVFVASVKTAKQKK